MATKRGLLLSEDLTAQAGITYRQLDYWCREGLLEFEGGESSGRDRFFEPREMEVAALLGRLSRLGLSPSSDIATEAARIARSGVQGVATDGPVSIFVA